MSRAKLFNMIKSRGTRENGRNPFDLSNMHVYSEKCMKINPVKVIDTIPKDYFDVDISTFIQSNGPLKTSAFVRGRNELAAYYVPYNTIWHNFNQYQATRDDPESSVLKEQGTWYEPRFAIWHMYQSALAMYCEYVFCQYVHPIAAEESPYTFANAFISAVRAGHFEDEQYFALLAAARNECWNHELDSYSKYAIYLIEQWDDYFWPHMTSTEGYWKTYNGIDTTDHPFFRSTLACDLCGVPCWCDVIRKFDMLGYGNIYPAFKLAEDQISSLFESIVKDIPDSDDLPGLVLDLKSGVNEILGSVAEFLKEISSASNMTQEVVGEVTRNVGTYEYLNVYPMFGYNRCFKDMFRNTVYDIDYDVRNFNCDFADCTTLAGSTILPEQLPARFWKLESHQYEKDMFTGILPDTQFGAVSGVSLSNISLSLRDTSLSLNTTDDNGKWRTFEGTTPTPNSAVSTNANGKNLLADDATLYHYHTLSNNQLQSLTGRLSASSLNAFDVLALRRAECLQQYRMDLLRAGNKTKDIFKQIYGSNPKSMLDEAPYFIDVCGSDINVNPIMATADTGQGQNGNLGDIAGRVLVNNNGSFKFSTEDFGLIIILSYTVVRSMYNSYRINPHRMNLTPEDHMIPELMNLGFEPIIRSWLNGSKKASVRHSIMGFSLPYLEFKSDVDECHGNFVDMARFGDDANNNPRNYQGSNSIWVAARTEMQNDTTTRLSNFYGDSRILDNVMQIQAGVDYESDQFICHTGIRNNAVRQLSELGLPQF